MTKEPTLSDHAIHRLTLKIQLHADHQIAVESVREKLLKVPGFSVLEPEPGDEDEDGGTIWLAGTVEKGRIPVYYWCDRASEYECSLGAQLIDGPGVFVQFGPLGYDELPHIRLAFSAFDCNGAQAAKAVGRHLRTAFRDRNLLDASRLAVERLWATYLVKGLTLREVLVEHRKAGPFETVVNTSGVVCGYQFGMEAGPVLWGVVRRRSNTRQTKTSYGWRQTREVAVRDCWPGNADYPAVEISVKLAVPTTVADLEEGGALVGLKLKYPNVDGDGAAVVKCWRSRSAWQRVVNDIRMAFSDSKRQGC